MVLAPFLRLNRAVCNGMFLCSSVTRAAQHQLELIRDSVFALAEDRVRVRELLAGNRRPLKAIPSRAPGAPKMVSPSSSAKQRLIFGFSFSCR